MFDISYVTSTLDPFCRETAKSKPADEARRGCKFINGSRELLPVNILSLHHAGIKWYDALIHLCRDAISGFDVGV